MYISIYRSTHKSFKISKYMIIWEMRVAENSKVVLAKKYKIKNVLLFRTWTNKYLTEDDVNQTRFKIIMPQSIDILSLLLKHSISENFKKKTNLTVCSGIPKEPVTWFVKHSDNYTRGIQHFQQQPSNFAFCHYYKCAFDSASVEIVEKFVLGCCILIWVQRSKMK